MDIRKVKKLIELLEESGISEIEISEGEESVRISRYPHPGTVSVQTLQAAAAGRSSRTRAGRRASGSGTAARGTRSASHGSDGRHVL